MTTICALAIALSLTAVSPAPQKRSSDPDLRELSTYTLTMDTVNKVARVNETMIAALQKDPRYAEAATLQKELDALDEKDELTEAEQKRKAEIEARIETLESSDSNGFSLNDAKDLTEMAAKIQAYPPLVSALRSQGLTPREYAKFMMAMIQAGFSAGLKKAGMLKEIPEGVNPANITFVLEHEAELKKLQNPGGGGQMQ
jgi:hypothetical protein